VIALAVALMFPTVSIWPFLGMLGPMHGPVGKFTLYGMVFGPALLVASIVIGIVAYRTARLGFLIAATALLGTAAAAWVLVLQT